MGTALYRISGTIAQMTRPETTSTRFERNIGRYVRVIEQHSFLREGLVCAFRVLAVETCFEYADQFVLT